MRKVPWSLPIAIALLMLMSVPVSADNLLNRLFGGCGIRGSGDLETEERDLGEFDAVKLSGAFDVFIEVGSEQRVKITFDDNLLDIIETEVRRNTLYISSKESYSSRRHCRIEISIPELEKVSLSGSGDIEIDGLDGEEFIVEISGSGDVRAEGHVDELDIQVSGSGDVNARDLEAKDAYVSVSGSGDVRVYASESLNARVSGSGDIQYYGDPEHISTRVAGSGDISRR